MKKLGLMVVGAFFTLATTSAVAQTVKQTSNRTQSTRVQKTNTGTGTLTQSTRGTKNASSERTATTTQNTQEYSTAPVSGITNYKAQADNAQQGASAENGEDVTTIIQNEQGDKPVTTTGKNGNRKTMSATKTTTHKMDSKSKVRVN